jgi:hypothetical protein
VLFQEERQKEGAKEIPQKRRKRERETDAEGSDLDLCSEIEYTRYTLKGI